MEAILAELCTNCVASFLAFDEQTKRDLFHLEKLVDKAPQA